MVCQEKFVRIIDDHALAHATYLLILLPSHCLSLRHIGLNEEPDVA